MIIYEKNELLQRTSYNLYSVDEFNNKFFIRNSDVYLHEFKWDDTTLFFIFTRNKAETDILYDYLNEKLIYSSYNTRKAAAHGLQTFFQFLDIFNYELENIDVGKMQEYVRFLAGTTIQNNIIKDINRCNHTINLKLSIVRKFYAVNAIKCDALFFTKKFQYENPLLQSNYENKNSFFVNKKELPYTVKETKSISLDEFKRLIKVIKSHNDLVGELLVLLMYGLGIRIGSALGLTTEDLIKRKIKDTSYCFLLLRNRPTDKSYQLVKNFPNFNSHTQMTLTDIDNFTQYIYMSNTFYERINSILYDLEMRIALNKCSRYHKSVATSYSGKENHYIMLKDNGSLLTDQTWNLHLRKYMIEAGIPIDYDKRRFNLNHKFRHGFAMYHAKVQGVSIVDLQHALGHRDISSTSVYFEATFAEEIEHKKSFLDDFYKQLDGVMDE